MATACIFHTFTGHGHYQNHYSYFSSQGMTKQEKCITDIKISTCIQNH